MGGFGDFLSGGEGRQLCSLDISLASSQSPAVAPTSSSPCLAVAPAFRWPMPASPHTPYSSLLPVLQPRHAQTCLRAFELAVLCAQNVPLCPVSPGWTWTSLFASEMPSSQSGLPGHLAAVSPCTAVFSSHSCLLSSSPTTLGVVLPAGSVLLRAWHGEGQAMTEGGGRCREAALWCQNDTRTNAVGPREPGSASSVPQLRGGLGTALLFL